MSRTHVHAPHWVALNRVGLEVHDHTRGECDLPDAEVRESYHHHGPAVCKKVTRYSVVCHHRYRQHPSWEYRESFQNPELLQEHLFSPKPHRVVSVTNVETGRVISRDDYPELPETCDTYNYPLYGRYSPREGRPIPLLEPVTRELAEHTYTVQVYNPETPCSCDHHRRYGFCYRTLPAADFDKYYPSNRDPWFLQNRSNRGAVRDSLSELRALYNAGNLEDGDGEFFQGVDLTR